MVTTNTFATINDVPLRYPTTPLDALSRDAQTLYAWAVSHRQQIDRDVLDQSTWRTYVNQAHRDKYEPTSQIRAAMAELEAAGFARLSTQWLPNSVYAHRLAESYTLVRGRGEYLITIEQLPVGMGHEELLAVMVGASIRDRARQSGMVELELRARHETATDLEHDASSTGWFTVCNPSPIRFSDGGFSFTATLTAASAYRLGDDPLTFHPDSAEPGEQWEPKWCDGINEGPDGGAAPHPFAPFQPPALPGVTAPQMVNVTVRPLLAWQVDI